MVSWNMKTKWAESKIKWADLKLKWANLRLKWAELTNIGQLETHLCRFEPQIGLLEGQTGWLKAQMARHEALINLRFIRGSPGSRESRAELQCDMNTGLIYRISMMQEFREIISCYRILEGKKSGKLWSNRRWSLLKQYNYHIQYA